MGMNAMAFYRQTGIDHSRLGTETLYCVDCKVHLRFASGGFAMSCDTDPEDDVVMTVIGACDGSCASMQLTEDGEAAQLVKKFLATGECGEVRHKATPSLQSPEDPGYEG